jgi:pimeloyl-ACP methyl ester carboxylesterase
VDDRIEYNEFELFHENAAEYGLSYTSAPVVRRISTEVDWGRRLSALVWGENPPELVLLHGGSQNAHTWDTVAMALNRPLVAIDLPGHGHSDGSGEYSDEVAHVAGNAIDVSKVVAELAPDAAGVVGMSFGGLTAIALAQSAPHLVRKLILVDILPGLSSTRAKHIADFIDGPASFASLEELLDRTAKFNPTRSRSSLRRGILHNAEQTVDSSWVWRWARHRSALSPVARREPTGRLYGEVWEAVDSIRVPLALARGMRTDSVLGDDDEAELRRRVPSAKVVHFGNAGHSVQGDSPLELAQMINEFVFDT